MKGILSLWAGHTKATEDSLVSRKNYTMDIGESKPGHNRQPVLRLERSMDPMYNVMYTTPGIVLHYHPTYSKGCILRAIRNGSTYRGYFWRRAVSNDRRNGMLRLGAGEPNPILQYNKVALVNTYYNMEDLQTVYPHVSASKVQEAMYTGKEYLDSTWRPLMPYPMVRKLARSDKDGTVIQKYDSVIAAKRSDGAYLPGGIYRSLNHPGWTYRDFLWTWVYE